MRLLLKTNRVYLIFSAILLMITGILLFFLITSVIKNEATEKLTINKERIKRELIKGKHFENLSPVLEVEEVSVMPATKKIVKDTMMFDPVEEDEELFHEVTSYELIRDKKYRITLRQVILEPHDYYNSIGFLLLCMMVILLVCLQWINWRISTNLWKPFYNNLELIKRFSIQDNEPILLGESDIKEFSELNIAIENFSEKIISDYNALKEFSENAAHEMQTPLAVIKSKLELFLQAESLDEEQAKQIKSAYDSTVRLSKLNKALLLLTQIENRQFTDSEQMSLTQIIEKQLLIYEDFISVKNLAVTKLFEMDVKIKTSPILIETLVSNLINNAIKHNIENGNLTIGLKNHSLVISNNGKPLLVSPETLFNRFSKADPSSQSLGLGLAICKKICDINKWKINYTVNNEKHSMMVDFTEG